MENVDNSICKEQLSLGTNKTDLLEAKVDLKEWKSADGEILSYKGKDKTVVVPEKIKGITINSIGCYAFSRYAPRLSFESEWNRRDIESICLPEGIIKIGACSFYGCEKLKSINLPKKITTIASSAFSGCKELEDIELPATLKTIDDRAFATCLKLEKMEIPYGVEKIDSAAFHKCESLTNITVPETVQKIGNDLFKDCRALETAEIKTQSIKSLSGTFEGCGSLKKVSISASIEEIGYRTFGGCEKLTEIKLPSNLVTIGDGAFCGCKSILKLQLPDTLKTIGNGAFGDCGSLTNIDLPGSINQIGERAFQGCISLEEIVIPASVKKVYSSSFKGCSKLKRIVFMGDAVIDNKAVYGKQKPSDDHPQFANHLDVVLVGPKDSLIEKYAIKHNMLFCPLEKYLQGENPTTRLSAKFEDLCLTREDAKKLWRYKKLPNKTISLCRYIGDQNIVSIPVKIEELDVSRVDAECFDYGTERLAEKIRYALKCITSIYIPESIDVDIETIAVLPALEKIRACDAFLDKLCNNPEKIELFENLQTIELATADSRFCSNDGVVYDKKLEKLLFCARKCCVEVLDIPKTVKTIADYAFNKNGTIKDLVIPDSVSSIGAKAFNDTKIVSLTIGANADLSNVTFGFNCSIENIIFNEGIRTIPNTFQECMRLKSITIPESVTEIDEEAFHGSGEWFSMIYDTLSVITAHVCAGSYAEKYVVEHGYNIDYLPGEKAKMDENSKKLLFAQHFSEKYGDPMDSLNTWLNCREPYGQERFATGANPAIVFKALKVLGKLDDDLMEKVISKLQRMEKETENDSYLACFLQLDADKLPPFATEYLAHAYEIISSPQHIVLAYRRLGKRQIETALEKYAKC